ncbi:MAG: hypothetical protein V4666_12315 [Bacteroidota bacterium]
MGIGLLIGFIILLIIVITSIISLIYSIKRKSKVGIGISTLFLVFVIFLFSENYINEITINNEDVRKDLGNLNINLKEDFKIIRNEVTGMPYTLQKTELEISKNDASKIIGIIKSSKNYVEKNDDENLPSYSKNEIINLKHSKFYTRELNGEIDNVPTRLWIYIEDGKNVIEYTKYED